MLIQVKQSLVQLINYVVVILDVGTYRIWEERQEWDLSWTRAILGSCCQDGATNVSSNSHTDIRSTVWETCLLDSFWFLSSFLFNSFQNFSFFRYDMQSCISNIFPGSHGRSSKRTLCLNWKKSWMISTLQHRNIERHIIPMWTMFPSKRWRWGS